MVGDLPLCVEACMLAAVTIWRDRTAMLCARMVMADNNIHETSTKVHICTRSNVRSSVSASFGRACYIRSTGDTVRENSSIEAVCHKT